MLGIMSLSPQIIRKILFWLGPLGALALICCADLSPGHPEVTRMAAVAYWMGVWWLGETIPLPVTALLPVILFPLLGILKGDDTAGLYFNSIIFLFMGGFIIALAMQRWHLHKRVALMIIHCVGVSPRRLLLGFMLATGFISMWMSNTATTMMMFPIALAVVLKLEESLAHTRLTLPQTEKFSAGLLLSIAYASSIGGFSTLIGTPPNMSFLRKLEIFFPQAPPISFAGWMVFALPLSVLMLLGAWLILSWLHCPSRVEKQANQADPEPDRDTLSATSLFQQQYRELGPMAREEKTVAAIFLTTALLWITRTDFVLGDLTLRGWGGLFGGRMDDGTVAIVMATLLFLLPSGRVGNDGHRESILRWEDMKELPWGVILIFGGGFALASGMQESGLSAWMGEHLGVMQSWNPLVMVLVICVFMVVLSEFMSNIAAVEMLLPILASTSIAMQVNPLLLMIPATLCASYGFMLPVSTAPNTIVYGSGRIKVQQMYRAGFLLNVLGIFLTTIFIFLLGGLVFGITAGEMPDWAKAVPMKNP